MTMLDATFTTEARWLVPGGCYRAEVYATVAGRRSLASYCLHRHRSEGVALDCAKALRRRIAKPIPYPAIG